MRRTIATGGRSVIGGRGCGTRPDVYRGAVTTLRTPTPGLGTPRRWAVFGLGVALLLTGIATSINAGLGVGSWQVLETGLARVTGAGLDLVIFGEAALAILLAWVWLGERPWIATVLLAFGGIGITAALDVVPVPGTVLGQAVQLGAGMVLLAFGVAFYLASDLGASAQDSLFVGIYRKYRLRPAWVRFGVDALVVGLGILLGGQFGVGTFAVTLGVPLMIEPALRLGHRLADTPLPEAMRPAVQDVSAQDPATEDEPEVTPAAAVETAIADHRC